jgi:hypothetical protein
LSSRIAVRYLGEEEYPTWNKVVASSPLGSIYSTPEYLDVLCSVAGGRFKILTVWRGDECVGGVALYEVRTRLGTFVKPRLLLYYNGIVLAQHEAKYASQRTSRAGEVLDAVREALTAASYRYVSLRNRGPLQDVRTFLQRGWQAAPRYSYVVSVSDPAVTWARMDQNLRRLVKRCVSAGLEFVDDSDFDVFYAMHRRTAERKGAPLYLPERAFRQYFEKLKTLGLCRLFHSRLPDRRSISSQLVLLGSHPVSHTVCAAADEEFLNMGATAFLRWKSFEALSRLGCTGNDLTDAALNPVTQFKSQLGGDLEMGLQLTQPSLLSLARDGLAYLKHSISPKPDARQGHHR